jgi:hypothetical protein
MGTGVAAALGRWSEFEERVAFLKGVGSAGSWAGRRILYIPT